jgi:two-component system CheB/CheR fusion protein
VPAALSTLAVALVYFAAAKLGLTMAFVAEQVSPVWPPTGIALAAMLLDRRLWPGIALGAFFANLTAHEPVATAAGIATGNTLEAVLGAWLLRRSGTRPSLERLRDVLALIGLAALGSTTVSATIGVTSLCLGGVQPWHDFGSLWWVWWIGDAMGDLVMAPLLLVWVSSPPRRWRRWRVTEGAAVVGGLVALSIVVFAGLRGLGGSRAPLEYAVFPFVVWGAVRFGQLGVVTVTFVSSTLAIASTVNGFGPLAVGTVHESLVLLQLYLAVVAVTGLLLGAAIMERNAAERRRAAHLARVRLSEERLRLALDAARMGVWEWDVQSGRVQWSENLEAIHGLAPGAFDGTFAAFRALVHPEDRPRLEAAIQCALDGTAAYDVEFRIVPPDGRVRWMAGKGTVFRDARGRPTRMLGVGMDVTEHKRLEEELRTRAGQLAEADRRKTEFLAVLAHELRNPLAPICNAVELLARRGADRSLVEQACALIERQVRHMVRLVDDLLEVSRITSGKIRLQKQVLDLATVVADAVATSRPLLDARRHTLAVELPAEPLRLEADPVRVTQVLANLLHNAAKFTPEGGRVSLRAERRGAEVVVRVRDTGIGMSPEVLRRAFEPFAQADTSLDRADGGLGIGLTLVRSLVDLHGGAVTAESEGAGRGSVLTVRLPAAAAAVEAAPGRRAPVPEAAGARRVLVVDDNVDTAESLAMLLGMDGYDVCTAHSGPAAIDAARRFAPQAVVLDIGLPGMDGYTVARALRADVTFAGCRLIAVSGYGQDEDRRRAREAGFDEHLVKPVEPDALRALLGPPAAPPPLRAVG